MIEHDIDIAADTFDTGENLLAAFNDEEVYDIVLLDIEMNGLNGIDTAREIRNNVSKTTITVFISNHAKYMYDSFAVHPYHFITKPYSYETIENLLKDIVSDISDRKSLYTIVSDNDTEYTINLRNVLYFKSISSKKKILEIHLSNQIIETRGTIAYWEDLLADKGFIMCHRGFLLNLIHVRFFEKSTIMLDNNEEIPVSRALRKNIIDKYLNHIFESSI